MDNAPWLHPAATTAPDWIHFGGKYDVDWPTGECLFLRILQLMDYWTWEINHGPIDGMAGMAHDRHLGGPFRLPAHGPSSVPAAKNDEVHPPGAEVTHASLDVCACHFGPECDVSYGGSSNATSSNQPGTLFLFPSLAPRIAALRLRFIPHEPACLSPGSLHRPELPSFPRACLGPKGSCAVLYISTFKCIIHSRSRYLRPAPTPAGWGPTGGVCHSQS
jgi:hypothetical protein